MHFKFRNVNDAFVGLVQGIFSGGIRVNVVPSRNGETLQIEEPVTVTYGRPLERVLFNEARDANPFFHIYEALWMLAGRNDLAPLKYYVDTFDQYSDDGKTLNGAYGYRWRHARLLQDYDSHHPAMYISKFNPDRYEEAEVWADQIKLLVDHIKANPFSRRAVLDMWNVEDDLMKVGFGKEPCKACDGDGSISYQWAKEEAVRTGGKRVPLSDGRDGFYYVTGEGKEIGFKTVGGPCTVCKGTKETQAGYSKDVCCNLSAVFKVEDERYLNMTVFNRSNDLIWGMLGANVVHFSFLQEYMAASLGLGVGSYHQISCDLHTYTERWDPEKWLAGTDPTKRTMHSPTLWNYDNHVKRTVPLLGEPARFDRECAEFVERHQKDAFANGYGEPFLMHVAQPMCIAYHWHKNRRYSEALEAVSSVKADDWRLAGTNWLKKRQKWYMEKQNVNKTEGVADESGPA